MMSRILIVTAVVILGVSLPARAQSFEAGLHVSAAQWSEFEGTDYGVGARLTWLPVAPIGLEADVTWFPSSFPDEVAFSGHRLEGMVGITAGPVLGRLRPFARIAAGVLHSSEAPEPFPCIAIYPPPIQCLMASGHTLPAVDVGGGVSIGLSDRSFLRLDAASRLLRYPAPTIRSDPQRATEEEFWGSGLRLTLGAGVRF